MKQELCQLDESAPSHLTIGQAARALGVSNQAIANRIRRGTLPVEIWHGTKMIPTAAVLKAAKRKEKP